MCLLYDSVPFNPNGRTENVGPNLGSCNHIDFRRVANLFTRAEFVLDTSCITKPYDWHTDCSAHTSDSFGAAAWWWPCLIIQQADLSWLENNLRADHGHGSKPHKDQRLVFSSSGVTICQSTCNRLICVSSSIPSSWWVTHSLPMLDWKTNSYFVEECNIYSDLRDIRPVPGN